MQELDKIGLLKQGDKSAACSGNTAKSAYSSATPAAA